MAFIKLDKVSVEFPIYNSNAISLRKNFLRVATGGRVMRDTNERVIVRSINNVSLHIQHGDRVGLIGHNGAGKSTFLRLLAGIYEPSYGQIEVKGRVSSMLDIMHGIEAECTGYENIMIRGLMLGLNKDEIKFKTQDIADFSRLGDYLDMPVRTYSSGMMVRLAFAISSSIQPDILLIDEVFGAGDADFMASARTRMISLLNNSRIVVFASDSKGFAVEQARANAARAGVADLIEFSQKPLQQVQTLSEKGLLLINPPYGERLGEQLDLIPLYQDLGHTLHQHFRNWEAGVLTSDPMLSKAIGLRAHKSYAFFNGSIPCQLYCINVNPENHLRQIDSGQTQMLANRIQKNLSHLKKWADRQGIECFRVYDADIPEYAFAIDKYRDHFVIQEYMPPKTVAAHLAQKRRLDMMMLAPQVFQTSGDNIVFKERKPQKTEQYQKTDSKRQFFEVKEGQATFLVNLHDYLDTGLFLDHRPLRLEFAKLPRDTKFLNLFCYTATASVHAGLAGASTLNVDLSKTYINWASENFKKNHLSPQKHRFVQADVMNWLQEASEQFDVIYMDTPSFSNSKRMQGTLDIQRDHASMIRLVLDRLNPGGVLYFSTHLRSFHLDDSIAEMATVENISRKTIDIDFKRDLKIHQCYKLTIPR